MTVTELIAKLSKCPLDADVRIEIPGLSIDDLVAVFANSKVVKLVGNDFDDDNDDPTSEDDIRCDKCNEIDCVCEED